MTKISGYPNRPIQPGIDKQLSRSSEPAAAATPAAASSSKAVSITDQAKQLATLEQTLQSQPAINEGRVAEIQLAIQEGRYQIDPERIADKLLRFEQELSA